MQGMRGERGKDGKTGEAVRGIFFESQITGAFFSNASTLLYRGKTVALGFIPVYVLKPQFASDR